MPRDVARIVKRAWRRPDDEARQQELAEAWAEDPDAVEAAFDDLDLAARPSRRTPRHPPRPVWDPRGQQRTLWQNGLGTRQVHPLLAFHPQDTAQVAHVLAMAAANGRRVRAVGNGLSVTDCMIADEYLVSTAGLDRGLDLEADTLRVPPDGLVRVQAGIRVADLNVLLGQKGLCMPNNTAFDGQTLIGMFSTGSHGAGLGFGAVADCARSLTVVGEGGVVRTVEPADGITDPARFAARHPDRELVQDDEAFSACLVAMGCLGVITEVVIAAEEDYFLVEERHLMEWEDVKRMLTPEFLRAHRHVAVLLNPYVVDDPRSGIHGRSAIVAVRDLHPGPPSRHERYRALVALANLVPELPSRVMGRNPDRTPKFINQALRALGLRAAPYVGRGAEVLNFGGTQRNSAYALNVGVDARRAFEATDAVVDAMERRAAEGRQYATAPISIRWTGPSRAFMAPMYGRDTCMIEPPCLHPTRGGQEMLHALQRLLYGFGGRPHWGLEFNLAGEARLEQLWGDAYPRWRAQYRRFNAGGTFDSVFTERLGFSRLN